MKDYTKTTLGQMLSHKDSQIVRLAKGILGKMQKPKGNGYCDDSGNTYVKHSKIDYYYCWECWGQTEPDTKEII